MKLKPSITDDIDFSNYCIVTKHTDKKGFKISTDLLDELAKNAKRSNKKPLLIVSIMSDKLYTLKCTMEIK